MSDPKLTAVGHDEVGAGGVTGTHDEEAGARQNSLWSDAWRQLRRNVLFWIGAVLGLLFVGMALLPAVFARGVDPRSCNLSNSNAKPSAEHWFGFDQQGCDYLANVVYGARNSLIIGLLAVIVILVLGVLVGAISGFYGGVTDSILSRIADIFYALPLILGALVVLRSGILGRGVVAVAIALALFGWMTAMRLVRSQVIAIKSSDYVAAARAMGASDARILVRHILPNAVAPVLVYATITIGILIAAEATLTFLGVGLQPPAISWGLQIDTGQSLLRTAPHAVLFPSLILTLTVMAFVLMGDALRDALDPKQRS
ncbi:oligopeptide transport system permease protein [Blastococcus sp. DSM 46786]|uniref:ABC transporter permease n=1 Tax=Blastococcus sp. DSM 46786 TaxID=1798227 RepID=UPI0008C19FD5|nr:ABC transporter permease [Blastococcus sp. DSM 46786]SEK77629.1 oligopeptide transport system permease protein [Blastococcus sp. DSM 46786]